MNKPVSTAPSSSICPGCGESLACTANAQCWCMKMPTILPVTLGLTGDACFCQGCLSKKLAVKLERLIASTPHAEMLEQAARYRPIGEASSKLQEHLDYTTENGFMVFSAWYHLKRGTCCGNDCRHCPYPS
ncbi:DUF5522 domain-containing protein [Agarivorans sp. DSG3-1]|uniref:DUF5522 domain-containing protein n=1 Tax=Agarivorans sp. DSG3-1 TaxID=3342249 RepID=UPI00398EA1AF